MRSLLGVSVLLILAACSGEVRVIDVSDIRGPALAFIVDTDRGVPTQIGPARRIDSDGLLVDGQQDHDATGVSSHVIVLMEDSLQNDAGGYRSALQLDALYSARLAPLNPPAEPFENETGAWLPLRFPADSTVRPLDSDIEFSDILQVELPIERNYSCVIDGKIQDFEAEMAELRGGVQDFNDLIVLSPDRVLVSSMHYIMDLRRDLPLPAETGPRLFKVEAGEFLGQIEANPRRPTQFWATQRTGGGGTLREFLVDDEGFQATRVETGIPTSIVALGVMSDGTPVASGGPGGDFASTNVHIFDGLTPEPKHFLSSNVRHRIVGSVQERAISVGLQGSLKRYENRQWSSTPLADRNGVPLTPRGFAERWVGNTIETWVVGDEARVTRQRAGSELAQLFTAVPPNFRCQIIGDVVGNNFADIVIYQERFAIVAIDVCSDLLIIDLDNPDCTSILSYDGPASSPLVTNLQLHGDRIWISGDQALLRYADLKVP